MIATQFVRTRGAGRWPRAHARDRYLVAVCPPSGHVPGTQPRRRNALIFIARHDLQRALVSLQFAVTRSPRIVDLDIGGHDDIPWSCTDLALLDDGELLASAVLEVTRDAYEGGRRRGRRDRVASQ